MTVRVFTPFLIGLMCCNPAVAKETLIIAFSKLPPWKVIQNNEFKGVYAELAREISKEAGFNIEFKACPLKRCLHMMKIGSADLIIGVNHTEDRKKYIQFLSTPYRCSTSKVFYLRKNEHRSIEMYDDLYNFEHIGVKRGAKYNKEFDADVYLPKSPVLENNTNFYKLLKYRINTLIIEEAQGEFLIHKLQIRDRVKKAVFYFQDESYRYVGISKKSRHFKDFKLFNSAMLNISKSGKLNQLIREHYLIPYEITSGSFNCI